MQFVRSPTGRLIRQRIHRHVRLECGSPVDWLKPIGSFPKELPGHVRVDRGMKFLCAFMKRVVAANQAISFLMNVMNSIIQTIMYHKRGPPNVL